MAAQLKGQRAADAAGCARDQCAPIGESSLGHGGIYSRPILGRWYWFPARMAGLRVVFPARMARLYVGWSRHFVDRFVVAVSRLRIGVAVQRGAVAIAVHMAVGRAVDVAIAEAQLDGRLPRGAS